MILYNLLLNKIIILYEQNIKLLFSWLLKLNKGCIFVVAYLQHV